MSAPTAAGTWGMSLKASASPRKTPALRQLDLHDFQAGMTEAKAFQDYYPDETSHCYGCGRLNDHGYHIKSYWMARKPPLPSPPALPYRHPRRGLRRADRLPDRLPQHRHRSGGRLPARRPRDGHPASAALLTASLQVDYLRPTPLGVPLEIRGKVEEITDKKVIVSTTVIAKGEICAKGKVVPSKCRRISAYSRTNLQNSII